MKRRFIPTLLFIAGFISIIVMAKSPPKPIKYSFINNYAIEYLSILIFYIWSMPTFMIKLAAILQYWKAFWGVFSVSLMSIFFVLIYLDYQINQPAVLEFKPHHYFAIVTFYLWVAYDCIYMIISFKERRKTKVLIA